MVRSDTLTSTATHPAQPTSCPGRRRPTCPVWVSTGYPGGRSRTDPPRRPPRRRSRRARNRGGRQRPRRHGSGTGIAPTQRHERRGPGPPGDAGLGWHRWQVWREAATGPGRRPGGDHAGTGPARLPHRRSVVGLAMALTVIAVVTVGVATGPMPRPELPPRPPPTRPGPRGPRRSRPAPECQGPLSPDDRPPRPLWTPRPVSPRTRPATCSSPMPGPAGWSRSRPGTVTRSASPSRPVSWLPWPADRAGRPTPPPPPSSSTRPAICSSPYGPADRVEESSAHGGADGGMPTTAGRLVEVAGTGVPGFSGDGGPATAALVDDPGGVAVDAACDLLIADTGNCRLRGGRRCRDPLRAVGR